MLDRNLEKEMHRCSRNLLVVNTLILSFILFSVYLTQKYWYNFFFGPFKIAPQAIFGIDNPAKLATQFVVLNGDRTLDTKLQDIYRRYNKKTHEVTSEEIRGYYLLLLLGRKGLIVKSPVLTESTSFEGKLEQVPIDVLQAIKADCTPDQRKRILPMMLDVTNYKTSGYIALFFGIPLLVLAIRNLRNYLKRRSDSSEHPIMKALKKFGDDRALKAEIDDEMRSTNFKEVGSVLILKNWLMGKRPFTLDLIRMQDLIWIYKLKTSHSVNFIPTGTTYELVVNTVDGKNYHFGANEKNVEAAIVQVLERVPWIYAGFTEEIKKHWNTNRKGMIDAVAEAKRKAEKESTGGGAESTT